MALIGDTGRVEGTWVFTSSADTWGERLCDMACAFAESDIPVEDVTEVAIESLKGASNSPMLNCISGVFIQFLPNVILRPRSFITPSKWKAFIRQTTGEKSPLPKGMDSLALYDSSMPAMTDDEADAVMIGLTYFHQRW